MQHRTLTKKTFFCRAHQVVRTVRERKEFDLACTAFVLGHRRARVPQLRLCKERASFIRLCAK